MKVEILANDEGFRYFYKEDLNYGYRIHRHKAPASIAPDGSKAWWKNDSVYRRVDPI